MYWQCKQMHDVNICSYMYVNHIFLFPSLSDFSSFLLLSLPLFPSLSPLPTSLSPPSLPTLFVSSPRTSEEVENPFRAVDLQERLAKNPKTAPFMTDLEFTQKLDELSKDPNKLIK